MEQSSIRFCQQVLEFGSLSYTIKKPDFPNRARALSHPWMDSEQAVCGSAGVELRGAIFWGCELLLSAFGVPRARLPAARTGANRLLLAEPRGCTSISHPSLSPRLPQGKKAALGKNRAPPKGTRGAPRREQQRAG